MSSCFSAVLCRCLFLLGHDMLIFCLLCLIRAKITSTLLKFAQTWQLDGALAARKKTLEITFNTVLVLLQNVALVKK